MYSKYLKSCILNILSKDDLSSEYNIEKELVHKYINKLEFKSQKLIEQKEDFSISLVSFFYIFLIFQDKCLVMKKSTFL